MFVPFQNAKPSGPPEDFVTGWIVNNGSPGSAWGRPAVPLTAKDGSLLVSSDVGNKIWRISYTAR